MEYADNGDLFQKIVEHQKNKTMFEEKQIWKVIVQVVRGLKSLHDLNIMHRDLKSANVFLYKDFTAKLGDMNVSKVAKKNGLNYTQTGTPYYASPEVWKDEPYDVKSDIWSLGCVLYEMIALRPPFTSEDMAGLFKKVTKGYISRIPKVYSHDLWQLVKALIQVNPQHRPNCDQIINMPTFAKKASKYVSVLNKQEQNILLKTIKFPKNLMYLSDNLPRQNYHNDRSSSPSIEPQIERSASNHTLDQKKIKQNTQKQEIQLPSIQNVKQIYMNSLNNNPSTKEINNQAQQPATLSARRKKQQVQRKKSQKDYHSLNHSIAGKSDGPNQSDEQIAEEEQAKLQEMIKNVRKQMEPTHKQLQQNRNSVNLEILPEENQKKENNRIEKGENKVVHQSEATEKSLDKKNNELPQIVGAENMPSDIQKNIGKSRSPALFKSKLTASLNHNKPQLQSLDNSLLNNPQSVKEGQNHHQYDYLGVRGLNQVNLINSLKRPIHQQQKEERKNSTPQRINDILNRYNIKNIKSYSLNKKRKNYPHNYSIKQTLNNSLNPNSERNLLKSVSKPSIEEHIEEKQIINNKIPNNLHNQNPSVNPLHKHSLKLPNIDKSLNQKPKFVIEAMEIYKGSHIGPLKATKLQINKHKHGVSFDQRRI